jgi:hypothetical protein
LLFWCFVFLWCRIWWCLTVPAVYMSWVYSWKPLTLLFLISGGIWCGVGFCSFRIGGCYLLVVWMWHRQWVVDVACDWFS